ncbi:hypothetical protein B0A49_01850 [Cryomyces minteri]|uniref:Uncharacterized protein n=1 Tax=Cryomyces minteri TaxID=331657 RepID=A0A4U0XKV3_9PEZI|nr:hypothetical protein B0A49_01850 [Cryomyces minteri]
MPSAVSTTYLIEHHETLLVSMWEIGLRDQEIERLTHAIHWMEIERDNAFQERENTFKAAETRRSRRKGRKVERDEARRDEKRDRREGQRRRGARNLKI